MNILRRNPPDGDDEAAKPVAGQAGAQRIELTVEQEWVTMLVRGNADRAAAPPQAIPEEPAVEEHAAEAARRKLLPPPGGK